MTTTNFIIVVVDSGDKAVLKSHQNDGHNGQICITTSPRLQLVPYYLCNYLYLLTFGSRLIYGVMKLSITRHFPYIPSLGKVTPECDHAAAERSFFVVVCAITKRISEHVVHLVPMKGIANPLRPRTDRTAMVVRVHVHLVLQQKHIRRRLFNTISRFWTPYLNVPNV